jgi:asparagine synthase (glutamine-hydrolysing)
MCGFLGYIGSAPSPDLAAGAQRIRRRGPDSLGSWLSEGGNVAILHARLAISDTRPAAAQPISNTETGQTVAFVGEIYNHLTLRSLLPGPFRTDSDTETLLSIFGEQWKGAFPLLRGMFAICLVDENRREALLARDPIGKKPLFILPQAGGVFFCSSVAAISEEANVSEIDNEVALTWWRRGSVFWWSWASASFPWLSDGLGLQADAEGQVTPGSHVRYLDPQFLRGNYLGVSSKAS